MNANQSVNRHSNIMVWLVGVMLAPIDFRFFMCVLTTRLLLKLKEEGNKSQLAIAFLLILVWPAVACFDEEIPDWIVSVALVVFMGAWLMWEIREHKVKAILKLVLILLALLPWVYYLGWKANQ